MKLNKRQANFIRRKRVNNEYTWRAVARACAESHLFKNMKILSGNQIDGMELCTAAAGMFNEDYLKKPWN